MAETGRGWMWGGVVLASLLARPAWAEMPVTFPPGWTVSDLPGPTVDGHVAPGGRRRAVLPDAGGKLVAVIELTEEQLTGRQVADLPEVVGTARETMVTDYTAAGLDDRCADPVPVRAGRWDGMQLDCTVFRHDVPVVHQLIAMWVAPGAVYSLSYTAPTTSGQAGQAEFAEVLATVGTP